MTRTLSACTLACALLLGACDTTEPRVATTLELDATSALTLTAGDTLRLSATVLDQHGAAFTTPPSDVTINWSSNANTVATVSNGLVTAVSAGTATITASATGLTPASVQVTVEPRTYTAQISFNYAGETSGSYTLNSTFQIHPQSGPTSDHWAITFYNSAYQSHDVLAEQRRTDGLYDIFWVWSDGPPVTSAGTRAVVGIFLLGYDPEMDEEEYFYLVSGSIQFAAPAGGNLSGTFTMSGQELESGTALSITSGTFNLPLLSEEVMGMTAGFEQPGGTFLRAPLSRDELLR